MPNARDPAAELGITQPLLYRYFPTKEALVDRVYEEVFVRRWNPEWEEWLAHHSVPFAERLKTERAEQGRPARKPGGHLEAEVLVAPQRALRPNACGRRLA